MLSKKMALKEILMFSLPIILGHLGIMLIGTGDMIVAGKYSRECLAAIGLAISFANPVMISLLGFQFSISPLLAQKRGIGESIDNYFWTIVLYSLFVSIASTILTLLVVQLVPLFKYEENMTRLIQEYLVITSFSAPGLCLYQGLKEYFQSQEKTIAANLIALIAVGVNLFLNFSLVYGDFGFPELKEAGLAWASYGVRMFMALALLAISISSWRSQKKIKWQFMRELFLLGGPISFSLFLEIMAFCLVTLFVGKFNEVQTAANNIALNLGSLAFMVPMSVGAAVSVKVGHAFGERSKDRILVYGKVGLLTSFVFTSMMGLSFYIFPDWFLNFYTSDQFVMIWAGKLLFWVACFQLFDGAQVTLAGILRGLSVTRSTSLSIFFGYWIIGIPLGIYLGFYTKLESQGFWIGLAMSLAMVALMLGIVLKRKLKYLLLDEV